MAKTKKSGGKGSKSSKSAKTTSRASQAKVQSKNQPTEAASSVIRIKATDTKKVDNKKTNAKKTDAKKTTTKKTTKTPAKSTKPKRGFLRVIFTPFAALGRYIAGAFSELRQTRFPNRRATWKMTFMVIAYTFVFLLLIMALDFLFSALFNRILG
ncbi:preprotein translocase subunit SecE [Candidatus Saccharibacteria bacterium]|nr:preprotein translocase subunit SecE [Candidatus Saccharibacteria bacterium]